MLEAFLAEVRPQLPDTPYLFVNTHVLVPDPDKRCSISNLGRECRLAGRVAGVGVAQVQRQLGHTNIASTMHYTHLHVDDLRDSLDAMFARDTAVGRPTPPRRTRPRARAANDVVALPLPLDTGE